MIWPFAHGIDPTEWNSVLTVSSTRFVLLLQIVLHVLILGDFGIVAVQSDVARRGMFLRAAFAATVPAILGLLSRYA